jgi:hypothetical protein
VPPPDLIIALENGPLDVGRFMVVLWTWLVPRIGEIDGGLVKLSDIRRGALDTPAVHPDLASELDGLREADDLPRAGAALLVALDRFVAANGPAETAFGGPWPGIDGTDQLVAPWEPWIVNAYFDGDSRAGDTPPAADYAPSMAILARTITVVPVRTADGLQLLDVLVDADHEPETARAVALACDRFAEITRVGPSKPEEPPPFRVHLATLGDNPLNGLKNHPERAVFSYGDPSDGVRQEIEVAMRAAVAEAAAEGAAVLVLPELAIPVTSLSLLKDLVAHADPAPALTIAGLRHIATGDVAGSPWANEAVVLAEDGTTLFNHRKMTAFAHDGRQEDTQPGDVLAILRTHVGNAAVLTCLDSFGRAQQRLAASYASLVLVPSLSETVTPHRSALTETMRELWGFAAVCNRSPKGNGDAACTGERVQSFWTVAMLNAACLARRTPETGRTFVFDLRFDFHRSQQDSSNVAVDADTREGT